MHSFPTAQTGSRARFTTGALLTLGLAAWFLASALATPFDHDESQYAAGAALSTRLLVFRDFLYLQPPLHAWAFAPLAWLFPTGMMPAMRIATAFLALVTLALIFAAQRRAGIAPRNAAIAMLLMAATAAFQFTAAVVRNDMLATALFAGGLLASVAALRAERGGARWFLAGLLYGLAIATKLSFAPPAAAAGLFLLFRGTRRGFLSALWLALGGIAGLLPMLAALAVAPEAFLYGVLTYGATAPFAWYAANGAGHELGLAGKAAETALNLARGPLIIVLPALGIHRWRSRALARPEDRRFAAWMVAGGLIGAAMPTPAQLQYLMPVLPPLALSLGHMLDDARNWRSGRRRNLLALLCLAAIPGLAASAMAMLAMARHGSPVLAAQRDARWAGATVRRLTGGDTIATLSPHLVLDSGLALDPRFAPGPFVYRTGWLLRPDDAERFHVMTPQTLKRMDRNPPAAILTGYETGMRSLPRDVEAELRAHATARGYRVIAMPDGIGRLYYRPRETKAPQSQRP